MAVERIEVGDVFSPLPTQGLSAYCYKILKSIQINKQVEQVCKNIDTCQVSLLLGGKCVRSNQQMKKFSNIM